MPTNSQHEQSLAGQIAKRLLIVSCVLTLITPSFLFAGWKPFGGGGGGGGGGIKVGGWVGQQGNNIANTFKGGVNQAQANINQANQWRLQQQRDAERRAAQMNQWRIQQQQEAQRRAAQIEAQRRQQVYEMQRRAAAQAEAQRRQFQQAQQQQAIQNIGSAISNIFNQSRQQQSNFGQQLNSGYNRVQNSVNSSRQNIRYQPQSYSNTVNRVQQSVTNGYKQTGNLTNPIRKGVDNSKDVFNNSVNNVRQQGSSISKAANNSFNKSGLQQSSKSISDAYRSVKKSGSSIVQGGYKNIDAEVANLNSRLKKTEFSPTKITNNITRPTSLKNLTGAQEFASIDQRLKGLGIKPSKVAESLSNPIEKSISSGSKEIGDIDNRLAKLQKKGTDQLSGGLKIPSGYEDIKSEASGITGRLESLGITPGNMPQDVNRAFSSLEQTESLEELRIDNKLKGLGADTLSGANKTVGQITKSAKGLGSDVSKTAKNLGETTSSSIQDGLDDAARLEKHIRKHAGYLAQDTKKLGRKLDEGVRGGLADLNKGLISGQEAVQDGLDMFGTEVILPVGDSVIYGAQFAGNAAKGFASIPGMALGSLSRRNRQPTGAYVKRGENYSNEEALATQGYNPQQVAVLEAIESGQMSPDMIRNYDRYLDMNFRQALDEWYIKYGQYGVPLTDDIVDDIYQDASENAQRDWLAHYGLDENGNPIGTGTPVNNGVKIDHQFLMANLQRNSGVNGPDYDDNDPANDIRDTQQDFGDTSPGSYNDRYGSGSMSVGGGGKYTGPESEQPYMDIINKNNGADEGRSKKTSSTSKGSNASFPEWEGDQYDSGASPFRSGKATKSREQAGFELRQKYTANFNSKSGSMLGTRAQGVRSQVMQKYQGRITEIRTANQPPFQNTFGNPNVGGQQPFNGLQNGFGAQAGNQFGNPFQQIATAFGSLGQSQVGGFNNSSPSFTNQTAGTNRSQSGFSGNRSSTQTDFRNSQNSNGFSNSMQNQNDTSSEDVPFNNPQLADGTNADQGLNSKKHIENVVQTFRSLDDDNDGQLTLSEVPEEIGVHLFRVDQNQDFTLDTSEIVALNPKAYEYLSDKIDKWKEEQQRDNQKGSDKPAYQGKNTLDGAMDTWKEGYIDGAKSAYDFAKDKIRSVDPVRNAYADYRDSERMETFTQSVSMVAEFAKDQVYLDPVNRTFLPKEQVQAAEDRQAARVAFVDGIIEEAAIEREKARQLGPDALAEFDAYYAGRLGAEFVDPLTVVTGGGMLAVKGAKKVNQIRKVMGSIDQAPLGEGRKGIGKWMGIDGFAARTWNKSFTKLTDYLNVPRETAIDLQNISQKYDIIVEARPSNEFAERAIRNGTHEPKPVHVKQKTADGLDQMLGLNQNAPPGEVVREAVVYDPKFPTPEELSEMGLSDKETKKLRERFIEREKEWQAWNSNPEGVGNYRDEFDIVHSYSRDPETGAIVSSKGKRFTSDLDLYSVRDANSGIEYNLNSPDRNPPELREKARSIRESLIGKVNDKGELEGGLREVMHPQQMMQYDNLADNLYEAKRKYRDALKDIENFTPGSAAHRAAIQKAEVAGDNLREAQARVDKIDGYEARRDKYNEIDWAKAEEGNWNQSERDYGKFKNDEAEKLGQFHPNLPPRLVYSDEVMSINTKLRIWLNRKRK